MPPAETPAAQASVHGTEGQDIKEAHHGSGAEEEEDLEGWEEDEDDAPKFEFK
jgi:hypothetical protein